MSYDVVPETNPEQPTAVARATLSVEDIGAWLATVYGGIASSLQAAGISPSGPPFARHHAVGQARFEVEAGFPVPVPIAGDASAEPSSLPGGPAVRTLHVGPYDEMVPAFEALVKWIREHDGEPAGDPWEVYFSDPDEEPDPDRWRTEVVQPYRAAA